MVRFGVELVPTSSAKDMAEIAVLAERHGFDTVWVTDHYNNRSTFQTLALIAAQTERIELGPGVSNPYLRHPAILASEVASLDEISGGRAMLGLGPGDKMTFDSLGVERKRPLTALREAVSIIRALLRGEVVSFEGRMFSVKGAVLRFKPVRDVPIYIGAQGPKMLALAGEIGDGVLVNASHPKDFEFAIQHIREGAEKAGKSLSDVDVVAYTAFSIDEDPTKAFKASRKVVAFIVAGCPPSVLERHGIGVDEAAQISDFLTKGDFKSAFKSVTEQMVEEFSITGTPAECLSKVEELLSKGVTQVVVGSPIGPKIDKALKLFSDEIISKLRG